MFDHLVFWHWWIVAGVLLIIEMLAPTAFFLWLAIAAAITGLLTLIVPGMGAEWQLILFAVLSVLATLASRRWKLTKPGISDQPSLNRRGHYYIDRVFTLEEPVVNGIGKIKVDDSTWKINGPDLPAGDKVKVVSVDGVVLLVEPVVKI